MTRKEITLALLQTAAANEKGVTTQEFLTRGAGSRFGARILELRQEGWIIEGQVAESNGRRKRVNGYVYTLAGYDQSKAARNSEVTA